MKTLSFVKQAMAVALLISAVNASANVMDYVKGFANGAVAIAEKPARLTGWALGKVPYRKFAIKPVTRVDGVCEKAGNQFVATDDSKHDTLEAITAAQKTPKWTTKPVTRVVGEEGKWINFGTVAAQSRVAEYFANHETQAKVALVTTSALIVAGIGYGIYKAYKAFTGKTAEVVDQDAMQEEAEPVVETTEEEVVVQPARKQIVIKQPAA